ncbi:MAG: hypothetical protein HYZ37_01645 [Candidatus Solibacter usitatus]|nr:hypothetical protein [Candidatus Solibacter usitatus]
MSKPKSETARKNGAKSHGPITPEGKSASSQNALKHGFTSSIVLLQKEDPAELEALTHLYLDRFHPAGDAELLLVQDIASAAWRVRRLLGAETQLLEMEIARSAELLEEEFGNITLPSRVAFAIEALAGKNEGTLQLLLRYLGRARRDYARSERELTRLQSENTKLPNEPTVPSSRPVSTSYSPSPSPNLIPRQNTKSPAA